MRYIKYLLLILVFFSLFSMTLAQGGPAGLGLFSRLQKNKQSIVPSQLDCLETVNGRKCYILNQPRAGELFERNVSGDITYKKDIRDRYLKMAASSKEEADRLEKAYNDLSPEVKEAIRGMIAGFAGQYKNTSIVYIKSIERKNNRITVIMDGGYYPGAKIGSIKVEFQLN
jgi:hypothetical protein